MASVASQLIEEGTAHAQSDSLEDAQTVLTFRITYVQTNLTSCSFKLLLSHKNRRSTRQRFTMRLGQMAMHLASFPESPAPKTTFHTLRGLCRANLGIS